MKIATFTMLALTCLAVSTSQALTILSGPSFTSTTNAPLAGTLALTTDVDSRLSVSVSDGTQTWSRDFYSFNKIHSVPLAGFRPGRTNLITVTAYDKQRRPVVANQPLTFVSPTLPTDFPKLKLLSSQPQRMEPGYTLFRTAIRGGSRAYNMVVDNAGEVVWYNVGNSGLDVRQLHNGDLMMFSATEFIEFNLLGMTVRSWQVPANLRIDNHEALFNDHGTILYISTASAVVSNYPSSTTASNAPTRTATNVIYGRVIELSTTNSTALNNWSIIDMLDPRRITYLTTVGLAICDSQHCNSVAEDPRDDSILVSLRHQNAVVKFSRSTGQLIWILGPHENWGPEWQSYLLTPVGSTFAWQYGQHAAEVTPDGTLLLYDNGNFRACPFDTATPDTANYSRAVEYRIDESTREVSQVWEYGNNVAERLYTDRVGNAQWLPQTGNMLVNFGSVRYVNGSPPSSYGPGATMARIKEVTRDPVPEVLFDLAVTEYDNPNVSSKDCYVYRTWRISDLYGHPPLPVADLTVTYEGGKTILEFSGDPARSYSIETTTDLENWEEIGEASLNPEAGCHQFQDEYSPVSSTRYYRVVTH